MTKADYQVIVLGAGIGGLACAALLARRGLKVLVLEPGASPGGSNGTISRNDYQFGLGASVVWGFHEGDAFHHVLTELSCLDELLHDQRMMQRLDLPLQVILPYHRLNVYAERARLLHEMEREFADDLPEIRSFHGALDALANLLDDAEAGYPFAGQQAHGIRSALRRSAVNSAVKDCQREFEHIFDGRAIRPETRVFLAAQARFFGAISFGPRQMLQLASVFRLPERGVYAIRGGVQGLAKFIAERLRAYGGSITYGVADDKIMFKGSRAVGVKARVEGASVTLTTDVVVVNLGYEYMLDQLLGNDRNFGRIRKRFSQGVQPWVASSLLLGVDQAIIPEPMANQAVLIPDETQDPAGENLVLLSVNPKWDTSRAPAGKRALTVTTYLPSSDGGIDNLPAMNEEYVQRLLRRLERTLPFLSTAIDFQEVLQPTHFFHSSYRTADDLVRREGIPQELGMSGLPLQIGVKNLMFIGIDSYYGPNAAGSVMSGWVAADAITS